MAIEDGDMTRKAFREALGYALPVMLAYVSIGIPCGVMEAQVGFTPLMAFLFSATYYSGAGQFMVPNLWLAGASLPSIFLSVSFVTSRQLLYSTAFVPYLGNVSRGKSLAFAALVTDETFGVNLDRFSTDRHWDISRGLVVNVACVLSWASANSLGAAMGSAVDLPIDVLSFGMTAIFICLMVGQLRDQPALVAALAAGVGVSVCKLAGLGGIAIMVGALAGVACGVLADGRSGS